MRPTSITARMREARGLLTIGVALPAGCIAVALSAQVAGPVRAGDDFYTFANRDWLRATALPAGQSSFGPTAMLVARNEARVRDLIQCAARAPHRGPSGIDRALRQKVGDFYLSLTDADAIEAAGIRPVAAELKSIDHIRDRRMLSAELGHTLRPDDGTNTQTEGILGVWIHQGFDEADHYVPHLLQGGLGLGTAEAYSDQAGADLRARYTAHVAQVLGLAGDINAMKDAERVLALETAIARTHASRADTDDPFKTNNHWSVVDFERRAPGMDWRRYFRAAGLGRQDDFLVWQPSAVRGTSALVAHEPLISWKAYLTFHFLDHYAHVLPGAFTRFQEAPGDRRTKAIAWTSSALSEAVGRLYVERYFPSRSKAAAAAMAENIRSAFRDRLAKLAWMGPKTRVKALTKLAALNIGVGYPDHWTNYASLRIVRGDPYGNMRRAEAFAYREALAKLNRPVDPGEWTIIGPQAVGALINFSPNAIQFSAGILQPPYFDPNGDSAANYGSAGAGMAHEISHSFDVLGNLYDFRGRLKRWWTPQDLARYRAALEPLAAQYDAYCPRAGLCLDGKRLLGENIADLAGLRVAFDAYHLSLGRHGDRTIDGLTGDQRFFLAFARRWQLLQTEEALRRQVATDIHAPGPYRTSTVRNVDAWYSAFKITRGDRLYVQPQQRIAVW